MKFNRLFSGLSVVGLLAFSAGAAEPREYQSGPEPTPAAEPAVQESATPSARAAQFIQKLAGEWDGQLEVRRDTGETSASIVNISSQLQKDGKAVISCYQGYAFGKDFEGGSLVGFNPRTGQFESAWFDHVSGATMRCTAAESPDDSTLVFTGQLTTRQGRSSKVEQVVKMTDFTHYTNEWFVVSDDGQKSRILFLEMSRLPEGQLSFAAEKLRAASDAARTRGGVANVSQPVQAGDE